MNRKNRKYTAGATGLAVGLIVGLIGGVELDHVQPRIAQTSDTIRMGKMAITLRALRNRKPDVAIETLEIMLDGDLVTTASLARLHRLDSKDEKVLQIVKMYRTDYPRALDPSVAVLVSELLSGVPDPK